MAADITFTQRMENLEYKLDRVLTYLEAFCPQLNLDSSTIAGLNDPPPAANV